MSKQEKYITVAVYITTTSQKRKNSRPWAPVTGGARKWQAESTKLVLIRVQFCGLKIRLSKTEIAQEHNWKLSR